jgi:hypothetical protein
VLAAISALLHVAYRAGALTPWPLLDMDRTILWQKLEMADRGEPADLVLLGDSSCLMDVDARAMAGRRVLNFGTVSHLSLASHHLLLNRYLARAASPPSAVVILLHPDALRREESVPAVEAAFAAMQNGQLYADGRGFRVRLERWLGVAVLRQTLQARVLPVALSRGQGRRFGFTSVLRDELFANDGSLTATGRYQWAAGQGRAVYRVSGVTVEDSAQLALDVPLMIGLTPIPASFAPPDYPAVAAQLRANWAKAFRAPVTPLELPAVLPDALFADRLHLNADGQKIFTARLADCIFPGVGRP